MISNARPKRAPRTPPLHSPLKPMKPKPPLIHLRRNPLDSKTAKRNFARTQPFIDKNNYKEVM